VCLGMPGVLPVLNRRVVELAIRAGLATQCRIAPRSVFARKNYFYPDLPKGYQISQYELPLCTGGHVDVLVDGTVRRIGLTRIHIEEDTGKNLHDIEDGASLVDFNRSGVPLLEIVSEPDLRTPAEAGAYLRMLRAILQYLEICDGNMEEGSFRCDANVSVRPQGHAGFGTKVEVKNMNSFRAVEKALAFEIARQTEALAAGERLRQETRLWDADREETRPMRAKEHADDYRYFPEPDLPPLVVDPAWVEEIRATLPELPGPRRERFEREYGLSAYDADVLTQRKDLADYFEAGVRAGAPPKAMANWTTTEVLRLVREEKLDAALVIREWPVTAAQVAGLARLVEAGTITRSTAKALLSRLRGTGRDPAELVAAEGLAQVSDRGALERAVAEVLAAHPTQVAEYRAGKEKVLGFLVGRVMRASGGKANPQLVQELLRAALARAVS
jgi:aspartyl-tRNA(Asn)/glutamyl-tRNA(Gln) amidotransferase subunit B